MCSSLMNFVCSSKRTEKMEIPDEEVENSNNLAYICFERSVWRPEKPFYDWYVLDTQKLTLEKHEKMSDCNLLWSFGCATVMNSSVKLVYVVGGQPQSETCYADLDPPQNQVQFFDTTSTTQKWQLGVPMNGARSSSVVISLNNKLYVFGGLLADPSAPWAEYFDGDQWIPIQNTPSQITNLPCSSFGSAVYGGHNILVWNQGFFCIFDASTNQWNNSVIVTDRFEIRYKFELDIYTTKVAVINDALFWYFGGFFAYDLDRNDISEDPVYSFPKIAKIKPPFEICKTAFTSPILFTTGKDQLCLVWYEKPHLDLSLFVEYTDETIDYVENTTLQVYRLNFQVERIPSETSDPNIVLRPIQKEPLVSTVKGLAIQASAGMYWQNYGKGIHDCHGADPPQISSPSTLLGKLSDAMYELNYWQYQTEEETDVGSS